MMTSEEREGALLEMQRASSAFYLLAIHIGVHPFIEFCGLMNEYIKACEDAHIQGIDFSECDIHTNKLLPLASFRVNYINEKLDCIFTGRFIINNDIND